MALTLDEKTLVDTLTRVCLGVALLGLATAGVTETDIWGHFAIGLDMLREHRFLWVDPYSFTHDQPWINHEWLWDLGAAAIYRVAGLPGILALRGTLIGIVLWVVDRATRRAPASIRTQALIIVTIACLGQWQGTRPQIATLALYAVTLANLDAWWLPVLFACWANVHGGWLFGLAAVGTYSLGHWNRRQATLAVACVLSTLLNPYGPRLWLALGQALLRGWGEVAEWAPIWSHAAGWPALGVWVGLVVVSACLWHRVSAGWWAWIWTGVTVVAAAQSLRLIAIAAVTGAILLPGHWKDPVPTSPMRWTRPRRVAAGLALIVAAAMSLSFVMPTTSCFPPAARLLAPEPDAVAFIQGADVRGRAVVYFDFGEYVIFQLRDRLTVSIDNRRETVYSNAVVQAHLRFYQGLEPDYPTRLGADVVWLPRASVALSELERRGWKRRFDGTRTVILLRTEGPVVVGRPTSGTPCFPKP